MPPAIHYISHGYTTGYGVAGFRLLEGLVAAGVPVRWTPITFDGAHLDLPPGRKVHGRLEHLRDVELDPDVVIVHAVPELLEPVRARYAPTAPIVCHTVWETDRLQAHWSAPLNRCAGVIVPTAWNAEVFRASGVTVPVTVVPHATEGVERPADGRWLADLDDAFVAYGVAEWDARKSPWRAIEAFAAAFPDDPDAVYVLKTSPTTRDGNPRFRGPAGREGDTMFALARLLGEMGRRAPRVHLVNRFVTDPQLRGLHRRGDVWLTLPHAEGWDIGAFDAATAGTPVVTTGWGAPADYLDPSLSHLVPGPLVDVHVPPDDPEPQHHWVEPDLDVAVDALRWVRAHPEQARARAEAQAEAVRERFAPDVVAGQLLAALEVILG